MRKILIINANYYQKITKRLVNSAKKLANNKFKIKQITVPGVFEIPIAIRRNVKNMTLLLPLVVLSKEELRISI